jgi:glycosyltransferase involved in cell wall biosynthesis
MSIKVSKKKTNVVSGVFCHSLPIYKDINGHYCSTTLTDDLFKRYLDVVDFLYVATRVYPIDMTYEEAHQEIITLPNVKVIEFENMNNPKVFLSKYFSERNKMESIINECELIFIRGGIIALLAAGIAQRKHRSYLVEAAGCIFDEYWNYSILGKFIAPFLEIKERKAIKNADFVLYVTEKWLQDRYPTKGVSTYASNVILNKVDEINLERRIKKITCKENNTIIIGTTAGLSTKAKGQQYVIEILRRLSNNYDIRYEMVGGGDETYLKTVAAKYNASDLIEFKGQMNHEEVLEWLDSIDIYIQPSMQEGLPRALIEAMSRACPAIGSTTAGIPELLDKEFVFHRGNSEDLYKVLEKALSSNLIISAKRNFEKSKEFEFDKLQTRRIWLYRKYRETVIGEGLR